MGARGRRVAEFLGLERNVLAVSSAVFLLGASAFAVGCFGTANDLLDAVYQ